VKELFFGEYDKLSLGRSWTFCDYDFG